MADSANKPLVESSIALVAIVLLNVMLCVPVWSSTEPNQTKSDRPQIPYGFTSLDSIAIGVYDSKAQPAAEAVQALNIMYQKGWETIGKYYPELATISDATPVSVNPSDPEDHRFYSNHATEDPGRSPMPLIAMICSLDAGDVTGRLKSLRDELLNATRVDDFSTWTPEQLGHAIQGLTQIQTTGKGVKYRAPSKTLSLRQAVQLYAMTVALLDKDTKWPQWEESAHKLGYALPPPPNMTDFKNRLQHQLPITVPPGATRGMLLYRAGWDLAQPVSKTEYEERADVVLIRRSGTTFHLEQFPIYFTVEQKSWNPAWITEKDDEKDSTLTARKFEERWTRFDGPYMWYKSDQLAGQDTYHAIVKFQKDSIVIEGEHFVSSRGSVVRTTRDPTYDPLNAKRFVAGVERPLDPLTVDAPDLDMWPAIWRLLNRDINETCYRHDDRQLFWYPTGQNSFTSSVYPLKNGGTAVVQPLRPVDSPSGGLVARFSGSGAEQPNDVEPLDTDQQGSVRIAVALLNLCLSNASGSEVTSMRTSLPRDQDNLTPIYLYSVKNGTSVRKSPGSLVVVLSEGYYNGYVSAFNRLLWVLQKPLQNDPEKVSAINRSIAEYLRSGLPAGTSGQNDPAMIGWAQILQNGEVDHLFDLAILPAEKKRPEPAVPATFSDR